mmetsp:Transcript_45824/g.92478  ORF Transcript_45824/g.92478 Transcript_45824/m.92478 type:complete len:213 (+) Transcript_45824:293-931(+)
MATLPAVVSASTTAVARLASWGFPAPRRWPTRMDAAMPRAKGKLRKVKPQTLSKMMCASKLTKSPRSPASRLDTSKAQASSASMQAPGSARVRSARKSRRSCANPPSELEGPTGCRVSDFCTARGSGLVAAPLLKPNGFPVARAPPPPLRVALSSSSLSLLAGLPWCGRRLVGQVLACRARAHQRYAKRKPSCSHRITVVATGAPRKPKPRE